MTPRVAPPSRAAATRALVALTCTALLGTGALMPSALAAQDELPTAQLRQVMGGGAFGFSSTGRVQLDRDAFLVVFEIGADGRSRLVYPMSPRDRGFVRAESPVYVTLPSADVAFIRSAELYVPIVVAFTSDVQPNLSKFTESGRRWDFQYAADANESAQDKIIALALLLYGSLDMPFAVSSLELSPVMSASAQRTLSSCGYRYGGGVSPGFNRFMWDLWGPASIVETGWNLDQRYRDMQWYQWSWGGPALAYAFGSPFLSRSTSRGLWNQFGAGCDPLGQQFFNIALLSPRGVIPGDQTDDESLVPPPADRPELRPPGTVADVGIEPATPTEMRNRAEHVTAAGSRLSEARAASARGSGARGVLTREPAQDLVQRQEIERTIALLTARREAGWSNSIGDAFERVRAGRFESDMNDAEARGSRVAGASNSRGSRVRRPSGMGSGMGGQSSGVGQSSGGRSAGSSAGSSGGSSSRGGDPGRGSSTGSGRGGTGRPPGGGPF